jgi:hypothetical protein
MLGRMSWRGIGGPLRCFRANTAVSQRSGKEERQSTVRRPSMRLTCFARFWGLSLVGLGGLSALVERFSCIVWEQLGKS